MNGKTGCLPAAFEGARRAPLDLLARAELQVDRRVAVRLSQGRPASPRDPPAPAARSINPEGLGPDLRSFGHCLTTTAPCRGPAVPSRRCSSNGYLQNCRTSIAVDDSVSAIADRTVSLTANERCTSRSPAYRRVTARSGRKTGWGRSPRGGTNPTAQQLAAEVHTFRQIFQNL
jgi:hypothetical protein